MRLLDKEIGKNGKNPIAINYYNIKPKIKLRI